jgi:hypothetical protein
MCFNSSSLGTLQSKLFNSFKLYVNDVLVSAGPGHNVPAYVTQAISNITVLPFLRFDDDNVIALECFFASNLTSGEVGVMPRVQVRNLSEILILWWENNVSLTLSCYFFYLFENRV